MTAYDQTFQQCISSCCVMCVCYLLHLQNHQMSGWIMPPLRYHYVTTLVLRTTLPLRYHCATHYKLLGTELLVCVVTLGAYACGIVLRFIGD